MTQHRRQIVREVLPKLRESLRGRPAELVAVTATAAGKFVFGEWLALDLYYVVGAVLFWAGFVAVRHARNPSVLHRWGFTRNGFRRGMRMTAPYAAIGIGFCVVYGLISGGAVVNWNMAFLLLLYPVWGTIQQFLVVALLADNVVALSGERVSETSAVLSAAVLFAAIHVPETPLVFATFYLGIVTTSVFFRSRNIWAAGLFHGWYATLFYHLVMGEDPLGSILAAAFGG